MDKKALSVLEYNKILEKLSACAILPQTGMQIEEMPVYSDAQSTMRALNETDEARRIGVKCGSIPLVPFKNVIPAVKRAVISSQLSCGELLNIAHLLRVSEAVLRYFDVRDFEIEYPLLHGILCGIVPLSETKQEIFSAIISEEEVDDNASVTLAGIRRKKVSLSNKVRDILNSIIRTPSTAQALQEPIITMRDNRYVVPVRAEHKALVPGVVHDTSQSGATLFVEPMKVIETNNEIKKLEAQEKEEIGRILSELSALVAEGEGEIICNYNAIIKLDFIFAKARLADKMNASCPIINDKGIIDIKKARHPLIDPSKVVPVDVRLGQDFDTLVITGPNTGGKTVTLKTLGLLTLMAQSGLHIPASDGSQISVFENIFADIGDEQSIEQSLSTFSSHMVNIVDIIKKVSSKSLVLFDELGAGTDPTEGAALATAILKEVKHRGAKTVATTHYSEIKLYALSTDRVENAACEFDVETLRPTYRLLIGVLGKSNAFAIAQRLGIQKEIIDSAKEMIDAENVRFEDIVNSLEQSMKQTEADREYAQRLRREAEELKKKISDEDLKITARREKIMDEARREAKEILSRAKEDVDKRIKEIEKSISAKEEGKRLKALSEERRRIKTEINNIDDKLYETTVKRPVRKVRPSDLKLGTTVKIVSMGQSGDITRLPDANGNLEVQVGLLKVKTHISTIELADKTAEKPAKKRKTGVASVPSGITQSIKTEIDIRGMNADDGIMAVDKYIDDAYMAKLESVTIIHGKGTGVLRSSVHSYLRTNKLVKSYRLGNFGEGEAGVTIAELK